MKRTKGGRLVFPAWYVYLFGGLRQLPASQGGGYQWAPSLRRRVKKYYDEGWGEKYSLRRFVSLNR